MCACELDATGTLGPHQCRQPLADGSGHENKEVCIAARRRINALHIRFQKLLAYFSESFAVGDILTEKTGEPPLGICIEHPVSYSRRDEQEPWIGVVALNSHQLRQRLVD